MRSTTNKKSSGSKTDAVPEQLSGLTPEELEAESALALPERAVMSTLSLMAVDAPTDSVAAASDGAGAAHAAGASIPST